MEERNLIDNNYQRVYLDTILRKYKEDSESDTNSNNDDNIDCPNIRRDDFNAVVFKQELHDFNRIAKSSIGNNTRQNKTISYINEFNLFLDKYEASRYNSITEYNKAIDNESGENIKLHEKNESLDSTKLFVNFENALSTLIVNEDTNINAMGNEKVVFNDKVDTMPLLIEEPFNPYNVDVEFACDDFPIKNNTFTEMINELRDVDVSGKENMKETNSIISLDSESTQESMDEIKLDPSANYNSVSKIKSDFIDNINDNSDCDGYNSSDFEFISEKDAGLEGMIVNSLNATQSNDKDIKVSEKNEFKIDGEAIYDLEKPGPSGLANKRNKLLSDNRFCSTSSCDSYEEEHYNHIIPEGESFYELFSEPWSVFSFEAENKAFYSNKAMHFETDNIGFNVGLMYQKHEEYEVDESIKREALENGKKILTMYSSANKRFRKRTRFT